MDTLDQEMPQLIALREALAERGLELTLEQTDVFLSLAFDMCKITDGCILIEPSHKDYAVHVNLSADGNAGVEVWDYTD